MQNAKRAGVMEYWSTGVLKCWIKIVPQSISRVIEQHIAI